ncbi:uncharacterized protein LODBEIA_P59210 [Lodderomyces beijingensis]|uniref:Uncharacterized protein n=1 Tax=Lodderomyces beijingensis TaxID=1775926 RepID=A0ABP0ZU92_9ASCO
MDSSTQKANFYQNSNDSRFSQVSNGEVQAQNQVAAVDFNNLRKLSTSNSHSSEGSARTAKTKPLSKLFTRTKPSAKPSQDLTLNADETETSGYSTDSKFVQEPEELSKRKKLLKLSNKLTTSAKSSLELAPSGNAEFGTANSSLAKPKKNSRAMSVSSPVSTFHNFFHKPLTSSQQVRVEEKGRKDSSQTSPSKATIVLSSSNSNSIIVDSRVASYLKFTHAGHANDDADNAFDHSALLELQRKMFTPADSYIQNKISKHHHSEVGLGISGSLDRESVNLDARFDEFHQKLAEILKCVFVPSLQKSRKDCSPTLVLGGTIDHVGNSIKSNFIEVVTKSTRAQAGEKHHRSRKSSKTAPKGYPHTPQESKFEDSQEIDAYLFRSFVQDLSLTFMKFLLAMKTDIEHFLVSEDKPRTSTSTRAVKDSDWQQQWKLILRCWSFFNLKVRFLVSVIFEPLKVYLVQEIHSIIDVEVLDVESLLIRAFDRSIVRPFLLTRVATPISFPSDDAQRYKIDLSEDEEKYIGSHGHVREELLRCFGTIQSKSDPAAPKSDGDYDYSNHVLTLCIEMILKLSDSSTVV